MLLSLFIGDCEIDILMSRHMSTMENVAAQLNKMSTNTNNWRHLAQEYGMSESQILRLEPSCDSSPTKLILEHLTQTNPQMTLKDLLHALVFIQRKDAISALKKYLNGKKKVLCVTMHHNTRSLSSNILHFFYAREMQ